MTDGVLAAFEPVIARLGMHGWSPAEVDAMDVWVAARFMGDREFDPIIRGYRGPLTLPGDRDDTPSGKKGKGQRFGRFDPRRLKPRTSDPGRVLRGDDAR